ncbi:MAG TPA: hypothetical protein VJR87_08365 [Allosphingosinicella sp.]|nr:hypothetical protein [Allosphingosinicella sp.]
MKDNIILRTICGENAHNLRSEPSKHLLFERWFPNLGRNKGKASLLALGAAADYQAPWSGKADR